MVTVPATIPVTIPVPAPMEASAGILLAHVPPPASLKVVVEPMQTWFVPPIEAGNGLTVTFLVIRQNGDNS